PRFFFKSSRSTQKSNGFLFVVNKVTSLTCRFKQIESWIWRRAVVFEPRQISAAFWLQSNTARTAFPRAGSTSPPGVDLFGHAGRVGLEFRRLRLERIVVHSPGQIRVQEPILHRHQFGLPFYQLR
ncbi:MAG: hypothetical protein ACK48U_02855, partial [Planctomyces sp.]